MFAVGSTTYVIAILLLVNALLVREDTSDQRNEPWVTALKRLKAASEASTSNAAEISAKTIFSASSISATSPLNVIPIQILRTFDAHHLSRLFFSLS